MKRNRTSASGGGQQRAVFIPMLWRNAGRRALMRAVALRPLYPDFSNRDCEMPHVLIVDDDVNTREALAEIAAGEGFTAAVAGSIREAQLQILRQRPDVVLIDIKLPDGSGMDLFNDIESRA